MSCETWSVRLPRIASGERPADTSYEYRSPDHGRILRTQFCPQCGAAVGMTFERFPAVQAIMSGHVRYTLFDLAQPPAQSPQLLALGRCQLQDQLSLHTVRVWYGR